MRIFILSILLSQLMYAELSDTQRSIASQVYAVAKLFRASDGMTFEKALTSIAFRESSFRINKRGDLHMGIALRDSSLGIMQLRVTTAKHIIETTPLLKKEFKHLLSNEKTLIKMLLSNVEFSVMLSGYYMLQNYETALKRGLYNPYYSAISRHNGGWSNKVYYKKVIHDMQYLKKENVL